MNQSQTRLKYFNVWLILGWVLLFSIIYLSLTSHPPKIMNFGFGDKISHFVAYAALMLWFGQLFRSTKGLSICVVSFTLLGGLLEVLQWYGGVRFFEYFDMLANFIGVLIGLFLSKHWLANLFVMIEHQVLSVGDNSSR